MTGMTLIVDPARCQGHGRCELVNPTLFGMSEDGYGVVLDPQPVGGAKTDAYRAIGNCPEQAISLNESATPPTHPPTQIEEYS